MSDVLSIHDVLGSQGILSRRLAGFRERPQQVQMAESVRDAFLKPHHLLVEAPTGIGKSLGYLVPAILHLVAARKRVVISTHTIALQDQILTKDLPLLASCLPIEFTARKAIGRTNYLGLRRLELAERATQGFFPSDPARLAVERLRAFAESSDEGVRQDLSPAPPPDLWEMVQSESDNCLGRRCRTYDACFFQQSRLRLANADIVVTNHALFFIDLALRAQGLSLLPDYDAVVLDEGHQIADVATEHFGTEISRRNVQYLLSRIEGRKQDGGLVALLPEALRPTISECVDGASVGATDFFDALALWHEEHSHTHGRVREARIVEDTVTAPLTELASALHTVASKLDQEDLATEVQAFADRALGHAATITKLLAHGEPDFVYFTEPSGSRGNIRFAARPLDVNKTLRETLFQQTKSVILTSATLAAGPPPLGLSYAAEKLGCPEAELLTLPSPFRYPEQVRVHVPKGLPLVDDAEFEARASETILKYVERTGGGAFLLFTSYRSLDAFHARLVGPLESRQLLVLKQGGDLDRRVMLDRFRADGNAVLFGADSFWEGVDIPGAALRLVILTRLPFPVPTLPLHAARCERIEASGGSAFRDFSLPEAIVRFRQGFGRLIRSEDDEGLVVCLDRRLVDRPYGRKFRAALPPCPWESSAEP